MRHPDFEKIFGQFMQVPNGELRYQEWIDALNLDDSKPYGQCFREGWTDRHVDFQLWKTDAENTYWRVETGFPVESMNRNVYTKEELMMSSRTLAGGYVNLNHQYPLEDVEIPASEAVLYTFKLPNGETVETVITEAVIKVPNSLRCPINPSVTVNQLIRQKKIFNSSLESDCTYVSRDNKCEGMRYTGMALLTKHTLPGIPLTRIMPLESIMVEALHVSTPRTGVKPMKKIKVKVKEEDCPEGQIFDDEQGKCVPESTEKCVDNKKPKEQDTKGMSDKAILPDEAGQCPPGYVLSTIMGQCIPDESCPVGQHFDQDLQKCVGDTVAAPAAVDVSVGSSPAPAERREEVPDPVLTPKQPIQPGDPMPTIDRSGVAKKDVKVPQVPLDGDGKELDAVPDGQPPLQSDLAQASDPDVKTASHACPDGYSFDVASNMCVPNSPIAERIARMNAEERSKYHEKQCLGWQINYQVLAKALENMRGANKELNSRIKTLETRNAQYNTSKVEDQLNLRDRQRRVEDLTLDLDDTRRKLEDISKKHQLVARKYDDSMKINLEMSTKNNQVNEDYLKLAEKCQSLEAKLGKSRNLAKNIIKLKV